ncbi:MAG: NAD(P)H-dependent oxidoreductase [Burkholderiaceae bacterium]|nr:NAD(P)H-dependent oxidoreductase [Burkholderiaceae bacterium]
MKPILHILICSTRPGRVGPAVAQWAQQAALDNDKFDSKLVDLADFNLPVFDEPEHPRLQKYQHAHTKAWSASVNAADAFVLVLPEYNFGPPSALLNAMNYLVREWQYKPAAFVSYGGMSGGLRAVQVTKQLLTTLKVMPMLEAVAIPNVGQHLDADKAFAPNDFHASSADVMFDELYRWTQAMKPLRAPS